MQLFKISTKHLIYLITYAFTNTLLSFGIIYIINNALAGKTNFIAYNVTWVFLSLVLATYFLNIIFQKFLNKFCYSMLYKNEKLLFTTIMETSLIKLEKLGFQRFFTIVKDLRVFDFLPYTVTHTVNSILMLVLCLGYMFILSFSSALIVLGLISILIVCYFLVVNPMSKVVSKLRAYDDEYYKYVDDVMKGFKQLKLSFFKKDNLLNKFIIPNRDESEALDIKANYVFISINLISQYGIYFVIGIVLFLFPEWGLLDKDQVIAYVVVILFISAPINTLIDQQQMYTKFIVANKRIKAFMNDFNNEKEIITATTIEKKFEQLEFKNVSFNYDNNTKDSKFSLGPINLNIAQGSTVFVLGGNGSGKSTFINLLTGLYEPIEGEVLLNNYNVKETKERLKSLIAAVFTENHIFSNNYEGYQLENNKEYKDLLSLMQLDTVVTDDKETSARRKFSKGQSKRMSLIFSLLEKKPILVLDEWAADQDPIFRKFFYEKLIPKLKEAGITIIAVTHDDAYFHLADRIIKFDYGQIVKDISTEKEHELSNTNWL